jgi:hypothetical protein
MGTSPFLNAGAAPPLEVLAHQAVEQRRRLLELLSEYEAVKNEVIGVITNASAFGEEHSCVLLAMAKARRAKLEQALVELSQTMSIDQGVAAGFSR